jgi:hypothetical protein
MLLAGTLSAAALLVNSSPSITQVAGVFSDQIGRPPQSPPKLSPREYRNLKAQGALPEQLHNPRIPQVASIYKPQLVPKQAGYIT